MPRFQTVARVDDIPEGEGRAFEVGGRMIAVFNDRGAFRAIDDTCPHAGASLSHGSLVEGTVICAWHGWRFHLCDGSWADYRKVKIGVYPVRVVGDEVQIELPDSKPTGPLDEQPRVCDDPDSGKKLVVPAPLRKGLIMNAKDAIKHSMDMADMVLKTYVADLSDAELMTRPAKGANHLAWQFGHLISSEYQLISGVCAGASPQLPAGFHEQHGKETTGSDDRTKFLTKQQYLDLFDKLRRATKAALDKLSDADLDKPGPAHFAKICPTVGTVFNLAASHPLMHSGQFATVRRMLGKPILI